MRTPASWLFVLLATLRLAGAEPADLAAGPDGRLHLAIAGTELCAFAPFSADAQWRFGAATASPAGTATDGTMRFQLPLAGESLAGTATVVERSGAADASWTFTAANPVAFNSLAISAELGVATLIGGSWEADDKKGAFPAVFGDLHLVNAALRKFAITTAAGQRIEVTFPEPTQVLVQDNRKWSGQTFVLRFGRAMGKLAARESATIAMTIAVAGGLRCRRDEPVTIAAGDDWIPLKTELDIVPGSALDLSGLGLTDGPCGSRGRVIATPDGHFAYSDEPQTPRRFYGVNLCFSAQYLAKEQADLLLDRLVRLGYNTVRIHHYEFALTKPEWKPGFDWDAGQVDRLDYLMAGCAKRGLWLTTDLYVSRPVPGKQIGLTGDAPDANRFKMLVPVHEPAFQDWQTFARKLLDRVNPYTGKRLAEDPALAWISLINEGWIAGFDEVRKWPQWTAAWNRWLAQRFADRDALDLAIGDLDDKEDPAAGSVALPASMSTGTRRGRLCQVFLADTERAMVDRMRTFLREELRCPALLTDINYGLRMPTMQGVRATFDYVDDHFYVDHPEFIEKQWNLPSRSRNANPVRDGAPGGLSSAGQRIWGKPFTVSEFNYSGPGRFRGVGGILTGALASFQDWDAVWRFAYSHKDKDISTPAPIDYFNLVNDPLNQAADRAAVLLYLRRDLAPATNKVALVMPQALLRDPPSRLPVGSVDWLAWSARIGNAVVEDPARTSPLLPADAIPVALRGAGDRAALAKALAGRIPLAGADGVIRAGSGEFTIDPEHGILTIDTPRTAGGSADAGGGFAAAKAGVAVGNLSIGATVFVSSLDRSPIRNASRLLVTHLTDLQNTGARYAESNRQTLLAWGGLPHLVRNGTAEVRIALAEPAAYDVWSLATGGRRVAKVASRVDADGLHFTADVRGGDGACLLYEVVRR